MGANTTIMSPFVSICVFTQTTLCFGGFGNRNLFLGLEMGSDEVNDLNGGSKEKEASKRRQLTTSGLPCRTREVWSTRLIREP